MTKKDEKRLRGELRLLIRAMRHRYKRDSAINPDGYNTAYYSGATGAYGQALELVIKAQKGLSFRR